MVKNMSITLPEKKIVMLKSYNEQLEKRHRHKIGVSNIIEALIDGLGAGAIERAIVEKSIKNEFIAQKKAKATKRYIETIDNINNSATANFKQ